MNNVPVPPQPMLLGSAHAKIFEILLIVGYSLSIAVLALNFGLTFFCFKYSYAIFCLEIGMLCLNIFCLIVAILLRIWRNDGSVNNSKNSSSLCLASAIIALAIVILLSSGAEDGLFYYTISMLTGDYYKKNPDPKDMQDRFQIFKKIFNKYKDMSNNPDIGDIETKKYQRNLFRFLPWISINFNALIQALSIFFIIIIRQRIKYKTDLESSQSVQTQVAQELNQNKTNTQRNSATNLALSNNNPKIYEDINLKKPKKRRKSKDAQENGINSDNVDIVDKKKGKKKKKKKSKSKDKAKRKSKSNIK